MMGNGWFKRFEAGSVLAWMTALSLASCATPAQSPATPAPAAPERPKPVSIDADGIRVELSRAEVADGHLVLVTVKMPVSAPTAEAVLASAEKKPTESGEIPVSARFEHIELPFYPAEDQGPGIYQAMLAVPFDHKPGSAKVVVTVDSVELSKVLELPFKIVDGNYRVESLKVSPRFTSPRPRDLRRIQRDSKEVGRIYSRVTPIKYWKGPFKLPVDSKMTSVFGTKRMFNGQMQSFHQGMDLRAGVGTAIHAPATGRVVLAKSLFFTGNTVLLDHGYGFYTLYAHMSQIKVKKGTLLKTGSLIGLAGKTGRASGPHLHWGAVLHKAKLNPADLLQELQ